MKAHVARGALVVVLLLVAGCGGSGSGSSTVAQESTFRTDFKLSVTQFKKTAHDIGVAVKNAPSQSNSEIASTFTGLAADWQANLTHLKSLTPPASVAGEFTAMTDAAAKAEADLNAIVAAAQTSDANAAKLAAEKMVTDVLAAKAASQTIEHKLGIT